MKALQQWQPFNDVKISKPPSAKFSLQFFLFAQKNKLKILTYERWMREWW